MESELKCWQAFLQGDEDSFKLLFERYSPLLFNYGYRFTHKEELIEDSIQELFTKLWHHRENLSNTASVKNYIYKGFRRVLVVQIEQQNKKDNLPISSIPFDIELPRETEIMRQERLDEIKSKLQKALDKMTPRQREIIHLKFFEELSYDEIAEIMELSPRDTYKLLYRALDSLRKQLDNFGILSLLLLISYSKYHFLSH